MKPYLKQHWIEVSVVGVIGISLLVAFARLYVMQAFVSYDFVPCDTALHQCFVSECPSDDPRCAPYIQEDGMYYFAIQKHKGTTTEEYCSDDTKDSFANIVIDPMCSE